MHSQYQIVNHACEKSISESDIKIFLNEHSEIHQFKLNQNTINIKEYSKLNNPSEFQMLGIICFGSEFTWKDMEDVFLHLRGIFKIPTNPNFGFHFHRRYKRNRYNVYILLGK